MLGFLAAPAGFPLTIRADQGLCAGQGTQEGPTSAGAEHSINGWDRVLSTSGDVLQVDVWRDVSSILSNANPWWQQLGGNIGSSCTAMLTCLRRQRWQYE
jgi:hypothetical protein